MIFGSQAIPSGDALSQFDSLYVKEIAHGERAESNIEFGIKLH